MSSKKLKIKPIGTFFGPLEYKNESPRQGTLSSFNSGYIEIQSEYSNGLVGLEGFERIWILFYFDRNKTFNLKVSPPRTEKKFGLFATRSPHRPNFIGMTAAKLIKLEELKIYVEEVDILNHTPVIDVKPYIIESDCFPNAKQGWIESLEREYTVEFSEIAIRQLTWISKKSGLGFKSFLNAHLMHLPLCKEKKRLYNISSNSATIAFRTWRANFEVVECRVIVNKITSGYDPSELEDSEDPYKDKKIHRDFLLNDFKCPTDLLF